MELCVDERLESGDYMNIRVHIIAPYESMIAIIKECIPLFPEIIIHYSVGDLIKGVEIAVAEEKKGTDVIISRGGTAKLIKKSVAIPVIDMQLSGYDMIRSLTLASNLRDKTAIVGFSNITSGAQAIIDLLDLPLKVFTISDSEEVDPLILNLKNSNYKQIVGDVITLKTANAYGLKGFLIQSGKESIIKALEDAKLIYGYLQKNNNITHIFEQFILKDNQNMIILDENNEILYEHLKDFPFNPLTKDQLSILNTDLVINKNKITKNFVIDELMIDVIGYYYHFDLHAFKVYVLQKNAIRQLEQKGIKVHTDAISEPIATTSKSISIILDHIKKLYTKYEPILLQGDKGTGKDFITNYIHQELALEGMLLTIDFEEFNINHIDLIPLTNVSTIKIKNTEFIQDHDKLRRFVNTCLTYKIHLFIIMEHASTSELIPNLSVNKIIMPTLAERKEDIQSLAHYFLSYYHQKYGTTAVKIQNDALKLLEEHAYPVNIDDLRNLIKHIVLNETDYVIHLETIQKVISDSKTSSDIISSTGTLREIEKEVIKLVLKEENNNQSKAAERLGINRATLWRKLKE